MGRPTSFRFSAELLDRLDAEAAAAGVSVSALVTGLLEEGLKVRRFPGVVFRDGPTGRRAGLMGGPDVWEVIRDVRRAPGRGEARIRRVATESGLTESQVRLAVDFYSSFPDEIDARLAADERAAAQLREAATRRARLTG
ncbi:MAG TPA: CopG family transcriptional regulator [Acidimicrobiia bacterium]|nr:CopG family transcriptional regulator [Acidimicrobiia bacterium]